MERLSITIAICATLITGAGNTYAGTHFSNSPPFTFSLLDITFDATTSSPFLLNTLDIASSTSASTESSPFTLNTDTSEYREGTINGYVLNAAIGYSVTGASISAIGPTGTYQDPDGSDQQGFYQITDVPIGTYQMSTSRTGYYPNSIHNVVIYPNHVTRSNIFLPPPIPRTISGLVISVLGNDAILSWSPVSLDTVGNPVQISSYKVYRSPFEPLLFVPSIHNYVGMVSHPTTTFTEQNALQDSLGFYKVTAVAPNP